MGEAPLPGYLAGREVKFTECVDHVPRRRLDIGQIQLVGGKSDQPRTAPDPGEPLL